MVFSPDSANNMVPVKVARVLHIIEQNKKGVIVEQLLDTENIVVEKEVGYMNPVGQESLTRFDSQKKKSKGSASRKKNHKGKNKR